MPSYAQKDLTIGEVFNFNIGDKVHARFTAVDYLWSYDLDRFTILNKWHSTKLDTVFYERMNDGYSKTWGPPPTYSFFERIDTIYYTNLDSSIYTIHDGYTYDSLISRYDSIEIDSFAKNDADFCNTYVNGVQYSNWANNDDIAVTYKYGQEIGLAFSSYFEGLQTAPLVTDLIYYKKGMDTCGTPDLFNTVVRVESQYEMKLFPNPVGNLIQIENPPNSNIEYQIFHISGQVITHGKLNDDQIDVNTLNPGSYYILFINGDETYFSEFIKK